MTAVGDRTTQRSGTEGRRIGWVDRRLESGDAGRRGYWGLLTATGVVGLWWLVSALGIWSEIILPTPAKVWDAFIQSVTTHDGRRGLGGEYLWVHLWASLSRILQGVAWGIVIGLPLGMFIGLSRYANRLLGPAIDFLKALPPLGYFPLLILWFGIDDTSKIWLLGIAAFPPITVATAASVAAVRQERVSAALVLGAGRVSLLSKVVLPSIAGDVITGVRIAAGFAWSTIVAAETTNGLPGIGGLAWSTKKELRADVAVLCIIVIGLTAVAIDASLRAAERKLAPWKGRA